MIRLAPLDWPEGHKVAHIAPYPDQILFAGTVEEILREPPARFDLHQILTTDADGHETPVGVFKIDRSYHISFPFAPQTDIGLRALIIDAGAQGQGIATSAMGQLGAYLTQQYPTAAHVYLTAHLRNTAALTVYARAGFENTGDIWLLGSAGPQAVLRLPLSPATPL